MNKGVFFLLCVIFFGCSGTGKKGNQPYELVVAVELAGGGKPDGPNRIVQMEVDTVDASSSLTAYSKGIQRYAAMLMHIQQFPDSINGLKGLMVRDGKGNDIVAAIPQTQRDSIIMNFIQFARRSDIPYYERVKDFELKLMTAR
ncbi:hypothetical protein [Parapedobacter indicus]|uniref:Uncharacterized protein n=1 Tax=Parapedobacter indicus TaxID=1477437 RepID=A0A1I3CWV0_9SPHI|nr:hypothetical protein [Parapedobacter indicus]PPL04423.1 hypothetical protein CLV26_101225 [Parapedobacter indicus]SFH78701.1 hypothetical protein SAMN05444682_101212 [Parapedobacter indicus]